eukprot:2855745-Alexandrium_andersonii.AAC.1
MAAQISSDRTGGKDVKERTPGNGSTRGLRVVWRSLQSSVHGGGRGFCGKGVGSPWSFLGRLGACQVGVSRGPQRFLGSSIGTGPPAFHVLEPCLRARSFKSWRLGTASASAVA